LSQESLTHLTIVILADSLALSRGKEAGNVPYESTYPFLLEQALRARLVNQAPHVIERGMRLRTIQNVLNDWYEMVELRHADVVIVHVGVVDCAPRIFLPLERKIVSVIRPVCLRESIVHFTAQHRRAIIQLRPNRVYVPLEKFRKGVETVAHYASNLRALILINIITPLDDLEYRSPGFRRNVEAYNHVLQAQANGKNVFVVDLDNLVWQHADPAQLMVEGIHINEAGHRILAQELENCILKICEAIPH
jgi:lysophospholipase L1-like esterase